MSLLDDYTKAVLSGSKTRKTLTGRVIPVLCINRLERNTVRLDGRFIAGCQAVFIICFICGDKLRYTAVLDDYTKLDNYLIRLT